METTKLKKTRPWNVQDLEKVLRKLKSKQSQDANGFANELFQVNNAGDDLKASLVIMFNKIKQNLHLPSVLRDADITAIPKNKKSHLQLDNLRGIFLVNKVKSILMKLIQNTMINDIEDNLTESNIGARKARSTRDHLFVVNSIINEVKKDKSKEPINMVFYDVKQCYDSL